MTPLSDELVACCAKVTTKVNSANPTGIVDASPESAAAPPAIWFASFTATPHREKRSRTCQEQCSQTLQRSRCRDFAGGCSQTCPPSLENLRTDPPDPNRRHGSQVRCARAL